MFGKGDNGSIGRRVAEAGIKWSLEEAKVKGGRKVAKKRKK